MKTRNFLQENIPFIEKNTIVEEDYFTIFLNKIKNKRKFKQR